MSEEYTSMQILLAIMGIRDEVLDEIRDTGGGVGAEDFYTRVVARALSIETGKVTAMMRSVAKKALFAYTYGTRGKALVALMKRDQPKTTEDDNGG